MKKFFFIIISISVLSIWSCGGGSGSSTSQPITHNNFSGNWRADSLLFDANLNLSTSDNLHYTGHLSLLNKDTGLTLTADLSGILAWGFTQSPTICASPASRTWMITPFSNIQGHLFSSTDNISYADGTLWDYATINFSQMNFAFGFNYGSGSSLCTVLWFNRK